MRHILGWVLLCWAGLAMAQNQSITTSGMLAPVPFQSVDQNGVDLLTGRFNISSPALTMGSGAMSGKFQLHRNGNSWAPNTPSLSLDSNWHIFINTEAGGSEEYANATQGTTTNWFGPPSISGGTGYRYDYQQIKPNVGGALSCYFTGGISGAGWITWCGYRTRQGVTGTFFGHVPSSGGYPNQYRYSFKAFGNALTWPGGYSDGVNTITYNPGTGSKFNSNIDITFQAGYKVSTLGLQNKPDITFTLQNTNGSGASQTLVVSTPNLNTSVATDSYLQPFNITQTMTDPTGAVWSYTFNGSGDMTQVVNPSGVMVTLTYDGSHRVQTYSSGGSTWTYSYNFADNSTGAGTTTVTDPLNAQKRVSHVRKRGPATEIIDELGRVTTYGYDSTDRMTSVRYPDGNGMDYVYNAGGNVIEAHQVANSASGLPHIVVHAAYAVACDISDTSTLRRCNKPSSITDERGNVTTYDYDAYGAIQTVTYPAVTVGATTVQPQTRYSYSNLGSTNGIHVLSGTSVCRTTSSCTGTDDETVTNTTFNGAAQNYLPATISAGSGAAPSMTSTSYTYDNIGNVTTTTDPLGNVSYAYYDAARRITWTVSPDPDGSGTLRHRAAATTYRADGAVTGIYAGAADPGPANWVELQRVAYDYDGYGRRISESRYNNGTVVGMTQYGYDTLSRVNCTAVRMNPGAYGTLPGCTTATGGDYQDRIALQEYDAAGQSWKTTEAFGVSGVQRVTVTNSYTGNGGLATLMDANGNITSYTYDDYGRPRRTCYNAALSTCLTGPSDYEELTYATSGTGLGRVTGRRLRDNNSIAYEYDVLGRLTKMTPPAYTGIDHPITFSYDAVGHTTQVTDTVGGHTTSFAYDALGRTTWETGPWRAKQMSYDAAGRMTALDYGDGYSVSYTYDALNEMTGIYENGSTWLVSYGYDDLGRRIWMSRANGVNTALTYDNADRLTDLAHDLAGTSNDFAIKLSYNAANQIIERKDLKDAYGWTDAYNVNRGYTPNGLNQYINIVSKDMAGTTIGTIAPSYDGRGNLINAGGLSYSYTARNQLYGVSNGGWLYYDAVGRLDAEADGAGCKTWLDNLGSNIDAEMDCSGNTIRRYVYGPDNAPEVWYEGSGTGDKRWLIPDERGSVVAVTDGSGNAIRINSYDEYGIPATNNLGRFQYAGQAWLPNVRMYYARARIYSPTLGRFMQTDPIGYADGPNWYNYVGGDPINATDPSGLQYGPVLPGAGAGGSCKDCYSNGSMLYGSYGVSSGSTFGGNGGNNWVGWSAGLSRQDIFNSYNSLSFTMPVSLPQSGGAITTAQAACRSCHGIATDPRDRYTTDQENEDLVSFAWDAISLATAIGPEFRAARIMVTGRAKAVNLAEDLLMRQARSKPSIGKVIRSKLGDPRLPKGAIKLEQRARGGAVHYVRLPNGVYVDFKFVP